MILAAATVVSGGGALLGCGGGDNQKENGSPISAAGAAQTPTSASVGTGSAGVAAQGSNTPGKSSAPTVGSSGSRSVPTSSATSGTGASQTAPSGAPAASGGAAAASGGAPVASAGTSGTPAAGGGAPASSGVPTAAAGSCGPEVDIPPAMLGEQAMSSGGAPAFKNFGPWKPMHIENTGPSGASWVFFPEDFGKDGMKHPVFAWGPGAGTGPSNYKGYLDLLASHGFVTICQPSTNSGTQSIDWILKENETQGSMFFGKLDPDRVARGGHSMGALLSLSESKDPRLKATILVCGGSGGGGGGDGITYPSIFLGAKGEGGTMNFEGDYKDVKGPSLFVTKSMSDHVACGRDNMSPWIAFMRWQLCGEEAKYKKEFMPGGTFCQSPWEACMQKGFW